MTNPITGQLAARINMPDSGLRVYVESRGFEEVYHGNLGYCNGALKGVLWAYKSRFSEFDYLLGMMWAETGRKLVHHLDFLGYKHTTSLWPWNVSAEPFFFENSQIISKNDIGTRGNFTGGAIIVFGQEELHRLKCKNLSDYLDNPPNLGEHEPRLSRTWQMDWE